MVAPDSTIRETDVRDPSGLRRRYSTDRGGVFTVSDYDAKVLRQEGYTEASMSGTTSRSTGRRCVDCGFGSFFVKCSRCGGTCEKEA